MFGVREVAGSNPVVPTINKALTAVVRGSRSCVVATCCELPHCTIVYAMLKPVTF
jgi:hypothetical protein